MRDPTQTEIWEMIESGRLAQARRDLLVARLRSEPGEDEDFDELVVALGLAGALSPVDLAVAAGEKGYGGLRERIREDFKKLGASNTGEIATSALGDNENVPERTASAHQPVDTSGRARGNFEDSADQLLAAAETSPQGDHAAWYRIGAAFDLWYTGRYERARKLAVEVRYETRNNTWDRRAEARRLAVDFLDALDVADDRDPNFCQLSGGLELVTEQLADVPSDVTTTVVLRNHLSDHLSTRRTLATELTIREALGVGAVVYMDEERSVGSRLLAVLAYDPVSTLVLLFDRHEGLLLRTWAEQARRSALFSGLSLVVVDSTVDPPSALDHDTRLDTIDACLLGPDGQEPPPALRAHLAQEAVTTLPEMPFPYCVLGQTLHAQIAAREHNDELLGEFNRWYRDVRCRFPLAEWPQQIYAQVLELYGRASEAGIAWTDALDIDVDDPRNAHGRARAAFELNLLDLAEATLSLGMVHAPNDVKMNQFRAVVALERNDLRMADLCARMACTLSGDDASSLLTRATVEERNGKDSKALLQSAVDKDPNSYTSHLRLYRANVSSGDWKEAEERITAMAALWPGNPDTVLLQSRILSIQGRGIDGMDRAIEGLQRFGSRPELVESVADLCTASFTDEELFVRIAGLAEQFATMPGFSSRFGYGLMVSGYPMAAVGVLGRALQSDPGEANIRWWLCQALCGFESQRSQGNADLRSLLVEFFEVYHSRYLPMVLLLAEQELSHDPERALHWLSDESVDINLAPALAWDLLDRILRALDRPDDAEGLRERISSLGPAGIVEHASFLRSSGRNAIASRLLSTALKENPGHAGVQEELAWCLLQEDHVVEAHAIASAMESPTYTLAVEVGSLSNDWEMVEKATDEIEAQYDGWTTLDRTIWPNRATAALAALGKGHDMPMASLLEKAGQDGRTLDLVRRRGRRLRHSLLDEINDRLQRVAPGRLGAEEWK